ncbi:transcriptional regulator [archaeon]|nr:transcriptional regulator [archaeon]|tara:strand:- start:106 stop:387 length:282 start_codon:yes stop_codon:yes gene_type:complete
MLILPRNDLKKQELLEPIAAKFQKDREYLESEVNKIIKSFDTEDHVLFRRELINFNYLGRDPYKGVYWLKKSKLSEEELEKIAARQKKIRKIE